MHQQFLQHFTFPIIRRDAWPGVHIEDFLVYNRCVSPTVIFTYKLFFYFILNGREKIKLTDTEVLI